MKRLVGDVGNGHREVNEALSTERMLQDGHGTPGVNAANTSSTAMV